MSTVIQTATTEENTALDTAVIAIIACAVIGSIIALIIIIICVSAKCAELKDHKRKADVIEKQLEVVEQVQKLALEAQEIAEMEEMKLVAEQQEAAIENMQQEQGMAMARQSMMTGGYMGGMMPQGNMMPQASATGAMMYPGGAGNMMAMNPQMSMAQGMAGSMQPMNPMPPQPASNVAAMQPAMQPATPSAMPSQTFQPRSTGSMTGHQQTSGVSKFPGLAPIEQGTYGDYYGNHFYNQ